MKSETTDSICPVTAIEKKLMGNQRSSPVPHGAQKPDWRLLLGEAGLSRRGRLVDGVALLAHQAGESAGAGGLFVHAGFELVGCWFRWDRCWVLVV